MTVATDFGEVVIVKNVVNDFRAEEIVRSIAIASDSMVGVTDHPIRGRDYKEAIIPNAISYAMSIGEVLRKEKAAQAGGGPWQLQFQNNSPGKYYLKGV